MANISAFWSSCVERARTTLLLISVASLIAACTTTIAKVEPIPVPAGLTLQQVELAIISGALSAPVPRELTNAQAITDSALKAGFGNRYRSPGSRTGKWFIESREPSKQLVYVGYQLKNHYLRVAVTYDRTKVGLEIAGSENLRQEGDSIHKNANNWVSDLKARIRQTLGEMQMSVK